MYQNAAGYIAGSDTSRAAAESLVSCLDSMREKVRLFVEEQGGAAGFEIEAGLDMTSQTVSARITDLLALGKLCVTGRRKYNPRHISVRVYAVCDRPPSNESLRPSNPYVGHSSVTTRNLIFDAVGILGTAIYEDIIKTTTLLPQTVTPAIADMLLLGTLVDTGERRKTTRNRPARVLRTNRPDEPTENERLFYHGN